MRPRIHTEAEIIAAGMELGSDDPFAVSASQIHKKLEGRGRLSIVANVWDAHLEKLEHAEAEEQPNLSTKLEEHMLQVLESTREGIKGLLLAQLQTHSNEMQLQCSAQNLVQEQQMAELEKRDRAKQEQVEYLDDLCEKQVDRIAELEKQVEQLSSEIHALKSSSDLEMTGRSVLMN